MRPLGFRQVGPHIWMGTLWYLILMALAIRQVEQLRWLKTVLLALAGFAADGMVSFLFVR